MRDKPIIKYDCEFIIRKNKVTPDKRFKSGFRKSEVIACSQTYVTYKRDGGFYAILDHIDKRGNCMYKTVFTADVEFQMNDMEQKL